LFGTRIDETAATVHAALGTAMGTMRRLGGPLLIPFTSHLPLPANRDFQHAKEMLDQIILQLIAARRQSGQDTGDMLSLLLFSHNEAGQGLTDEQIRDEALTLFLAGHETTANALAWTWYLLSQHPAVMAHLQHELATILSGRPPTLADLPQLTYTHHVISEAIRCYPPAWLMARQAQEDTLINDMPIHAGELIIMSQYLVHHDARWYPNPELFQPERWATMPSDMPRFAYFPFGGGPRLCIGERFAWMEAELVLATLAQQWSAHLVPGYPVVPQPLVTLRPKYGLHMMLTHVPS
ncbi:MAG: cytochrome P450, partial [Ktedonobacterales bacterium]|nr:cytochrome P450 [Ktedonobacterales bacterium]